MKKKLLAALFGATLVLGACGGGGDTDTGTDDGATGDDNASAVDAEAVFQQSCASCHGGNLEGASGPALDEIGADLSEDEIHDVIENGQGGMPGGLIKGDDADAVAEWLAAKK